MTDEEEFKGTLIFLKSDFGFIRPDVGDEDVFVHRTCLVPGQVIEGGDRVMYRVKADPKKPGRNRATKVQKVGK